MKYPDDAPMGRERIQSVQALRFIAAAMVVFNHGLQQAASLANPTLPNHPGIGAAGVDIFFVISGLVISLTGPLAEPRPTGAVFFWRRWSRVAPLFYAVSIPGILLLGEGLDWPRTVATLFFWPAAGQHLVQPYIGLGWTLCFEMMFYSTIAIFLAGGHLRRNAFFITVALGVLWFLRGRLAWTPMAMLANPIYLEFAAGVGLACLWPHLRSLPTWLGAIFVVLGIAGFVTMSVVGVGALLDAEGTLGDTIAFRRVAWFGLPGACIVTGALILERSLANRAATVALAWLGEASYSIYLAHCLTMMILWQLWPLIHPTAWVVVVVGFGVGIGAGVVVHLWIEKPLLRFARRLPHYTRRQIGRAERPSAGDLRPVVDDLVG